MLAFEWGVAVHDMDIEAIRAGEKSKDEVLEDLKGIGGKARTQIVKDYIAFPALSGLLAGGVAAGASALRKRRARRASGVAGVVGAASEARRGLRKRLPGRKRRSPVAGDLATELGAAFGEEFVRTFRATMWADVTANVVRNIWSNAIIFCGHFPDQTYTFSQEEVEDETQGRLVRAPALRRGQHRGLALLPRRQRQPRLPGRAPPVPGHAVDPLRRDRAEGQGHLQALRPALQHRARSASSG